MNTAILKKVSLKPLTLLAVLPLALTGCVSTATDSSSSNSEVKLVKPGTLSVCTNTSNTKTTAPSSAWTQTSPTLSPPTWV